MAPNTTVRRVKLFIAASLDGYIAGPRGEIDWLFSDHDYGYTPFAATVDTVVMGRRAYEFSLSFDEWPHPGKRCIVFSRHGTRVRSPDTEVVSYPPTEIIAGLRAEQGRDIWLLGGGELVRDFLNAQLIDEIDLAIHPIVLGNGVPLFPVGTKRAPLQLVGVKRYDTGLVTLRYRL